MILVVGISIITFYLKYFDSKEIKNKAQNKLPEKSFNEKLNKDVINNLSYKKYDMKGNIYVINSSAGKFDNAKKDKILLENVKAYIQLKNGERIKLESKNANYNMVTGDTNFINDVILVYQEHDLISKNIDFKFNDGYVVAYNQLFYNNNNFLVSADKLEIDLETTNTKISMFNKNNKVKILSK